MDCERPPKPDLVLEVEHRGRAALVSLAGDLDVVTAGELSGACGSAYEAGAREVVIDLTDTIFLDSSGLRALVAVQQLFGPNGGHVTLAHPRPPVRRLLEITGLADFFAIDDDPSD